MATNFIQTRMGRLMQILKPRWRLVSLVVFAPLLLTGLFVWMTDGHSSGASIRRLRPMVDAPAVNETARGLAIDRSVDRIEQLNNVRTAVKERRESVDHVALGIALLQLGNLEQTSGDDQAAESAFREVLTCHSDDQHWQHREAKRRLMVLAGLRQLPIESRERWKMAAEHYHDAWTLHAKGQYREAIERSVESLSIRRRLGGHEQIETAESLLQLAMLSIEHSDSYLQTETRVRDAEEALHSLLGLTHPACGDCLYLLARLADDRGDFEDADRLYQQSLENYAQSLGELSREFARALNRQGRMHNTWGKDYGAGKTFRAQQIRDQIVVRQHPDRAESLEDLAEVAYSMHNLAGAETLLREALDIRETLQGPAHPDIARPQGLLAAAIAEHGDLSQAEIHIHHALRLTEQSRGRKHPLWAQLRLVMGILQTRSAYDFAGGYRMLEQTKEVLRDLGMQRHPLYCHAIYEQADALLCETSMACLDEDGSLGTLELTRSKMLEAIEGFRGLPEGERISNYPNALLGLHEVYYYSNYAGVTKEEAHGIIEEAERIVNANGGALHPAYPFIPQERGRLAMAHGDYDIALPEFFERITRVSRQFGTTHPTYHGGGLRSYAGAFFHQGTDLESACTFQHQSYEVFLNFIRRNAAGQSDFSRLSTMYDGRYQMSAALCLGEALNDLPEAYHKVLAMRGIATSFQASDRVVHDHPELLPLRKTVREAQMVLKDVVFSMNSHDSGWLDRLQQASDDKELAESELALATRPFASADIDLSWQELQATLPPDMAFVDFVQYLHHTSPANHRGRLVREWRMLAFILKKSGRPECITLGSTRKIERQVNDWREALADFQAGNVSDLQTASEQLARTIWTPLLPFLADTDTLCIAPDGPLCFVSFAALPGRKKGDYAVEDFQISYVNSGKLLYQQLKQSRSASGNGLLVCGGIEYQRANRPASAQEISQSRDAPLPIPRDLKNLKATGLEIDRVNELYQTIVSGVVRNLKLSEDDATQSRLTAALEGSWHCVHFAGHGYFIDPAKTGFQSGHYVETVGQKAFFMQRHQLLLSGLVLAPNQYGSLEPTLLTAEDVGSLDLRSTDLVVLSACETGLGCNVGADGVLGLTRAFLNAGARSVVSSLWKVEDSATSLLMEEFYQNLWARGLPKVEALRQAQLTVLTLPERVSERSQQLALRGIQVGSPVLLERQQTDANRSHPALWAAFVLNGDSR